MRQASVMSNRLEQMDLELQREIQVGMIDLGVIHILNVRDLDAITKVKCVGREKQITQGRALEKSGIQGAVKERFDLLAQGLS